MGCCSFSGQNSHSEAYRSCIRSSGQIWRLKCRKSIILSPTKTACKHAPPQWGSESPPDSTRAVLWLGSKGGWAKSVGLMTHLLFICENFRNKTLTDKKVPIVLNLKIVTIAQWGAGKKGLTLFKVFITILNTLWLCLICQLFASGQNCQQLMDLAALPNVFSSGSGEISRDGLYLHPHGIQIVYSTQQDTINGSL